MEVACRLALESLPALPAETEKRLRVPIQTLCDVTQTELARLKPASRLDRLDGPDGVEAGVD